LQQPIDALDAVDGEIRPKTGGPGLGFGALLGGQRFGLTLDPKAPLRRPADYTVVGKPLPRPDVRARSPAPICMSTMSACPGCCTPG
jgi:hypothetical protein